MTDPRHALRQDFLTRAGWGKAGVCPLAGDASFRSYHRVTRDPETAVLMDAPPTNEDVRPFAAIATHLERLGYTVPSILAADPENGFLLLTDLGDVTVAKALADGAAPEPFYERAVDVLIDLHKRGPAAIPPGLESLMDGHLLPRLDLLLDWYCPAVLEHPVAEKDRAAYHAIWQDLWPLAEALPPTLVLLDYFPDNLMWLPDRPGLRACGLLDFQDALAGSPAYDLMSLLQDARRDVPKPLAEAMTTRYLAAFPALDPEAFHAAAAVMAAHRHARVIGVFTRLAIRDGKTGYLGHINRVWRLLEDACRHPALLPLQTWLDRVIPPSQRKVPSCSPPP
ncbi:MAG: aminoglycoside phosphotransferase family protein [Magnetospiraceae bacterium]